jgi:hypothetical protein
MPMKVSVISVVYDLRWEIMNVYTEIISENLIKLSVKPADNSVNSAEFRVSKFYRSSRGPT